MQEERKEPQVTESADTSKAKADNTVNGGTHNADTEETEICADSAASEEVKELTVEYDDTEADSTEEAEHKKGSDDKDTEGAPVPRRLPLALKITAIVALTLAIFSIVIRICFEKEPWAGEFFYRYVSRYLQAAFGALTSFIPFSLAETVLLMLPLVAVIILIFAIYRFIKRDAYRLKRMAVCIFTAVCLIASNYILNLSILYCRPSLSELSGIDDSDITVDELCASTLYMVYRLDKLVSGGGIPFDTSGASVCPYGFDELDKRINDAFDKYAEENDWISTFDAKAKIIAFSDPMTYTHISGIYTQYTGEANINVNYPDYIVCSTIAHEKAHQRGIAPEDEANLVAMFVLCESGDPYLEYCGYMSVFSNLTSDCYAAASKFYINNIMPYIPQEISDEFAAYARFFEKYRENEVSEKVDTVNDAYLKSNGETDGVISYDMVSGMAAKYILMQAEKEFAE